MAQDSKGWHPERIKAELRARFGPLRALSERWGLAEGTVSSAINAATTSSKVEAKIAEALDVAPHELWPDRWSPDGHPLPRTARINRISSPAPARRQKVAAE